MPVNREDRRGEGLFEGWGNPGPEGCENGSKWKPQFSFIASLLGQNLKGSLEVSPWSIQKEEDWKAMSPVVTEHKT